MHDDKDLEKMYSELERVHGESLEEKSAEAYHKSTQERMDVKVTTDSDNNPLRVTLTFGPHHFIVVGLIDGKVHVLKGETHHGTMYEAASVASEWESVVPGRNAIGIELPNEDREVVFLRELISSKAFEEKNDLPLKILERLLNSPNLCSRKWVWEQYDHMVMNDTVLRPGGDAAIVRVHGTNKGLAISADSTPRYCSADPVEGGRQVIAESWRNITSVGAMPIAITDCMNFGNPEKEEIMGQFAGVVTGMIEACETLDYPVVSGNVSLYNETNGKGINPTPAIGGVGLIKDLNHFSTPSIKREDDNILLLGQTNGYLGQSIYAKEILNNTSGLPPKIDLKSEKKIGDTVRDLININKIDTVHDVSDGGFLVALAEMSISGNIGVRINLDKENLNDKFLFGEDQGRYIISISDKQMSEITKIFNDREIFFQKVGKTCGKKLIINDNEEVEIEVLKNLHENWFNKYLEE